MSIISLPTSWVDAQILTASALNAEFAAIVNDYNGSITNANISALAVIDPTKISGTAVTLTSVQTLTNKVFDLASNTLTGTTAQFNTALSDGDFATLAGTETVTNKRITQRIGTTADAATLTPVGDSNDMFTVTALGQAATIAAPSGTPTNGQKLIIRLLDNGTARGLTWDTIYNVIGVTLPTTTVLSKYTYVGCIYNTANTKWDVLAVLTQA